MNTLMYAHPLTAAHLRVVRETLGYEVVGPIGKALACGDVGRFCSSSLLLGILFSHTVGPVLTTSAHRTRRDDGVEGYRADCGGEVRARERYGNSAIGWQHAVGESHPSSSSSSGSCLLTYIIKQVRNYITPG